MRFTGFIGLALLAAACGAAARAQGDAAGDFLGALQRAPALQAAAKRIEAARIRAGSAGRLADPEIEGMRSRLVGPMDERAEMWELNLRQPLPKKGERAADRDRAHAAVALAEADYAMLAGDLAAELAAILAEAQGADTRLALLEAQLRRFEAVLASIAARLATGGARLADRLTVQSRVAALQLQLEQTKGSAADFRSEFRVRLGLAPDAPLPVFSAPAAAEINSAESAALRVAAARSAEADAMSRMARASASPATSVGLRLERERRNAGSEHTLGVAFSSEIPWRSRRYAREDIRAAEADRAAAQAEGSAARFRIANAIARIERADRVLATARRLGTETETRLSVEHEALNRALSVGASAGMSSESAVLHAVDILDKSTETQLQIIDAETAARLTRAELWRYAPAQRFLRNVTSP